MIVPNGDPHTKPRLSLKKEPATSSVAVPPNATPHERELIQNVFRSWFLGVEQQIKLQLAEQLGVAPESITLQCTLDTASLPAALLELAQHAHTHKIPYTPEIVEALQNENGTVGFTYNIEHEDAVPIVMWKIASLSMAYPEIHPATWAVYRKNLAYRLTNRLNQWAADNTDASQSSLRELFAKDKKTPVFSLVSDTWANFTWSEEDIERGYRITQDFFAFEYSEGKTALQLPETNTTIPTSYSPGIERRHLMGRTDLCLVQMIVPIKDSLYSKEGLQKFVATVFALLNRKVPSELREELDTLFFGAEYERGPQLTEEQAAKVAEMQRELEARRRENGLTSLAEGDRDRKKMAGSLNTKGEKSKRFRQLRGAIIEDTAIEPSVRQKVLPLLARISSSIETTGAVDRKLADAVRELLPRYGENIDEL